MEYHNCNRTPIDRIDETLMKELRELDTSYVYDCTRENNSRVYGNCKANRCNVINNRCGHHDLVVNNCNAERELNHNSSIPALNGTSLAMVYSPHQSFDDLYEFDEGFCSGIIFKSLNFPFYMASCRGVKSPSCECVCDKCTGGR